MNALVSDESDSSFALRVIEFNAHVARFAHRSWFAPSRETEGFGAALFDAQGRIESRAEPHASTWLLAELGLLDDMDWQMAEPQKRIWLIAQPALGYLMQTVSLAMHREWLAQIIDGLRVRALRAALGERTLRFTLEELPHETLHHRAPVVRLDAEPMTELLSKLEEDGARTLMALLSPAWRAVRRRAPLYLDRRLALETVAPFDAAEAERALALVCQLIIPRRLPEWGWLF
jgi:hypothetical protein